MEQEMPVALLPQSKLVRSPNQFVNVSIVRDFAGRGCGGKQEKG